MSELTTFQLSVDSWHVALDEFDEQVRSREDDIRHQLRMILDDLQKWIEISTEYVSFSFLVYLIILAQSRDTEAV